MDISKYVWIFINSIIPSLPEQVFCIFFTLFILRKYESISINSKNAVRILISSLILSIISVLLRVTVPFLSEIGIFAIIGILITWIMIVFVYGIKGYKNIIKTLVCSIITSLIIFSVQFIYVPFLLYGTKSDLNVIGQPGLTSLIWSIPEMAIIIASIGLVMVKKNIYHKVSFITIISRNKLVMAITISLLFINIAFLGVMFKLIGIDKILINIEFTSQLLIIVMVVTFPILNLSMLVIALYSNYYRESLRTVLSKTRLNTLISILGIYTEEKRFDKIDNLIEELHKQINYI